MVLKSRVLPAQSLELASDWFLRSGIQEPDGGLARFHQTDTETNAPVSTEITGYAVSALIYAYRRTQSTEYLNAAIRSAHFLTRKAWDASLQTFPFELNGEGTHNRTYFFDCGIIVRGLLHAWRETREREFLESAKQGGMAMMEFLEGNQVRPLLELPAKEPIPPHASSWSRSPGCYQLKGAMAWHDLAEETKDPAYANAYERVLQMALDSHSSFLPAPQGGEKTMDRLHAYCYFLEGLLPAAKEQGMLAAAVISTLSAGIGAVSGYLRQIEPLFVRSDVYAQLLRLRIYSEAFAGIAVDRAEAQEEAIRMMPFQSYETSPRRYGGFYFGRLRDSLLPYVNPASTAFCSQAIDLWQDYLAGTLPANLELLI